MMKTERTHVKDPARLAPRYCLRLTFTALSVLLAAAAAAGAQEAQPPAAPTAASTPLVSTEAAVDVVCQTEVYFRWQKTPIEKTDEQGNRVALDPPPPSDTYHSTPTASGVSEADVRVRLEAQLESAKAQALSRCRSEHEDGAACISARMKQQTAEFERLTYQARRAVLAAIEEDCRSARGTCIGAEAKETRCYLYRPPQMQPPAAGADKKDEKKKK